MRRACAGMSDAVQYQQLVNDTGGSPTGWMDFVSCCLESSATPLLDLQSDPAMTGYFPGLEQVVIRDFMMADALPPHFGTAAQSPIVSINCTQSSCKFDGLSIESAGMLPVAVRSYAGGVTGTTIIAAGSGTYSAQGVVDARGLPTGTWKQTSGAGWWIAPMADDSLLVAGGRADDPTHRKEGGRNKEGEVCRDQRTEAANDTAGSGRINPETYDRNQNKTHKSLHISKTPHESDQRYATRVPPHQHSPFSRGGRKLTHHTS